MGKIVVVGSGFSGAIIARRIAEELNRKVIVYEKRNHIAGNMYDEIDEHGILVQKYGPHVLVTNEWKIFKYLSKFSDFYKHTVKELSFIDNKYIRLPFNFESIQQLLGPEKSEIVIHELRKLYPNRDRVPMREILECGVPEILEFANMLFEKSYKTYCAKQWNRPVEELDYSIMDRVPLTLSYDERYMNKDFQYLPKKGFTKMFENILNHPNIELKISIDAMKHLKLNNNNYEIFLDGENIDLLIFTGAIDELFSFCYGKLPYRSLNIEYEWFNKERIYPEKIISFPQAEGYTRRTEYKFMMEDYSNAKGTVIATEYPTEYVSGKSIAPFYPVITNTNKQIYKKYKVLADSYRNIFLCGRLAEFKYYNMDDCILHAFDVFDEIKEFINKKSS